jgi:gas vesicle protein
MKASKVLLGVLAGIAAGATLGVLFAPDKGEKTRRKIMNKGEDYADALKEKFDDLADTISNKYESIREEAGELVSKEIAKFHKMKEEANN